MSKSASRSSTNRPTSLRRRRGLVDFVIREGSSLAFSAALFYVLWGGFQARVATPVEAMWSVFVVGAICLVYVLAQALSAAMLPMRRETGPLFDTLVSLLPLLIIGYTAIDWARTGVAPPLFNEIVMLLAGIASLIDLTVFTWFSIRLNRLTPG